MVVVFLVMTSCYHAIRPGEASDSGHNIYLYEPAFVTDSIREIVGDIRGAEADATG
jgi:hypothetical protein